MTGLLHIVLARKPIEGTVAENCLQWGCGAINIEGCRVKGAKGTGVWGTSNQTINRDRKFNASPGMGDYRSAAVVENDGSIGRFPANLILGHCEGCTCKGTKKVKGHKGYPDGAKGWGFHGGVGGRHSDGTRDGEAIPGHADAEGMETIEEWQCEKDCVVGIIGEQSGVKKAGVAYEPKGKKMSRSIYGETNTLGRECGFGDTGTAARFFFNFAEQESDE